MSRIRRLAALVLASSLVLVACSTNNATPSPRASATPLPSASAVLPSESAPTPSESAPPAASANTGTGLTVASSATLGQYVTDSAGRTLYMFTDDVTPDTSTCTGVCLANWPALAVDAAGVIAGDATVTGAITTFTRPDGTVQASLAGHPLYYYAGDVDPGDVNGQGLNGKWFVVGPDGTMIDTPAPSAS